MLRMTKPIRFRTIKKGIQFIRDYFTEVGLQVQVLFGIVKHEKWSEQMPVEMHCVSKNAGVIVTDNIRFDIQLNRWVRRDVTIDRYLRRGKIIRDDSTKYDMTRYSAFPINIGVRISPEHEFSAVDNLQDTIIRLPDRNLRYEDYKVSEKPIEALRIERSYLDLELTDKERVDFENHLIVEILDEYKRYVKSDFKFVDCLEKRFN